MRARFITDTASVNVNPKEVEGSISVKSGSMSGQVNVKTTVVITDHKDLSGRDLPDQHPISSITGLEEALSNADKTFIFEQGVASSEWIINHNLNKYPSVSVVDSAGNEVIAEVTYVDLNNCVVTMTAAFKGKAYLN